MSALVVLATDIEELEAITTIDLLRRAGIEVTVASITGHKEVKCSRGVRIVTDKLLEECNESYDVIAIPGGMPGAVNLSKCQLLIQRMKDQLKAQKYVAAICASPAVVIEAMGIAFVKYHIESITHTIVKEGKLHRSHHSRVN